jgi:GH15 family glucan-1,4-alpha-glucosidase
LALMNSGYYEEAEAWRAWLLRAVAGDPSQMQTLYGIAGERRLTEWEIPWLDGYEGSRPVRIGNAASEQMQLEVMDAMHQARIERIAADGSAWALQLELLKHFETISDQPDRGIWEMRGDARQFTHSKVMAWVAFDRAVKAVEQFGHEGALDAWRAVRSRIHDEVCREAFDPDIGAFVQSYGSKQLDASVLLIPLVGFLPADDPRVRGTVEAIERNRVQDGFVTRYDRGARCDGLSGGEGVFLPRSFWLADNYALVGRRDDARRRFQSLLELRNDVGLLSEEYDPRTGRLVGNFPQALSHIALINTASNLSPSKKPAEQRSGISAP